MQLIYQIPRNSLAWLLAAYVGVIAPHATRIPIWIAGLALLTLVWRIQTYRGVWSVPPRWLRYSLVIAACSALYLHYRSLIGLEPTVALLVIAYSLKLLEMQQRRDALMVIYLAYFVLATEFLFAQTIATGFYVFGLCLVITTALMGLNQSQGHLKPWRSLRLSTRILLQALPLMLLLFIVLPRIGALWSVPNQQHAAKTGVSDSMSPGDFSRLARSGELAFRATFTSPLPLPSQRYWRGLVLSRFDGRTWTQAEPLDYFRDGPVIDWYGERSAPLPWQSLIQRMGEPTEYEIILEPSNQIWLYALATPQPRQAGVGLTRDFRLVAKAPVEQRFSYKVQSWLQYTAESGDLPRWRYQRETQLPPDVNPLSRERAQRWRQQAGSTQAFVDRVLALFNREFIYTLEPPLLGSDSVDEFLFETKAGFCEHFASSFVFLMRAAGIPARVVAGYQGGEVNPYQNYLLVHQFDAHAWAEVWLPGQGWRRVDPTAAVAPERVQENWQDLLNREGFLADSPMSLLRFRNIPWLNLLRLQLDRVDYLWHRWVLGYKSEFQLQFLTRLLGNTDPLRIAAAFLIAIILILGIVALRILFRGQVRGQPPAVKAYQRFCRKLQAIGIERQQGETPADFARRVAELRPDLAQTVMAITSLFEHYLYRVPSAQGDADAAHQPATQLVRRVRRFRPLRS